MRVRDGEERERERRIQLRVYIQKKSNETHKRQKRLKSMGGDTREDHTAYFIYPARFPSFNLYRPARRGKEARKRRISRGVLAPWREPAPSTRIPIGRPVALTWPVHTFQVRAGDSQCARRPSSLLPSHHPHRPHRPRRPRHPHRPHRPHRAVCRLRAPGRISAAVPCAFVTTLCGERHGVRVCMYCTYLIL